MVYILYNPNSNCGNYTNQMLDSAKKLFTECKCESLLNIADLKAYFNALSYDDEIVLIGGDGTLNVVLNKLRGVDIKNKFYLYKGGTGNDFLRDICGDTFESDELVLINKYIDNLPVVIVNGKEYLFVNNVGYGIDGKVCTAAEDLKAKGKQSVNYRTIAIKLLLTSYKTNGATVTVDSKTRKFKRVWMAPVMNGLYYGGGMMPCPQQDRLSDSISCCVVHSTNALQTLFIFPSLFKGEHVKYKSKVATFKGSEIKVVFDAPQDVQIDGETIRDVTEISTVKYSSLRKNECSKASATV